MIDNRDILLCMYMNNVWKDIINMGYTLVNREGEVIHRLDRLTDVTYTIENKKITINININHE